MREMWITFPIGLILVSRISFAAEVADFTEFDRAYVKDIRPIISRHCEKCHSPELTEAEIDLTAFPSFADVRHRPEVWQKVNEMLTTGQMPPKDAPQPTERDRDRLQKWVRGYLKVEARALAGDPGRVVLRRLNNVEYTNTIQDLTHVASLQPAREFPVDSAAGEGFTNLGNALAMSPALVTKYLDAAKGIAGHAVLLPTGFRFSPSTTPRDWTEELLAEIRGLYAKYTNAQGGTQVNLQGIVFDTNGGGRLPLGRYLEATIAERNAIETGSKSIDSVATERGLSPKYLGLLWKTLSSRESTFLFDGLRDRWRTATVADADAIAVDVSKWQQALWRFTSVGHIGKLGGPGAWMEPVSPITTRYDVRLKLPASDDANQVSLYLSATDAGDGNDNDFVIWQSPRLVAPGRPDVLLRDVRQVTRALLERRAQTFAITANCLNAASEAANARGKTNADELAQRHHVDATILSAWLDYLGVGTGGSVAIENHFSQHISKSAGYDFVSGWGTDATT